MAIAVNLYPTNYRAMATAFIMMCGRIGGVSGSSIIGLLLDNNCTLIFYIFGGILISKYTSTVMNSTNANSPNFCTFFQTGCAIVFMMIDIKSR